MKLESLKDIEPLKNKNIITLNTIGWTGSSEDEESKDNQLIDLSNINNLESQFTDKLQINKLTLSTQIAKKDYEELMIYTLKRIGILNLLPLIYNLKKDIHLLIHLTHQI